MPRGDNHNPITNKNLTQNNPNLTEEQKRAHYSRCGKLSGESKRRLKSLREVDIETTTPEERQKMLMAVKRKAMAGSLSAIKLYLEITGEYKKDVNVNVNGSVNNPFENLTTEELKELLNKEV